MEKLLKEFADIVRATRIAKGYNDYCLETAVKFTVADQVSMMKNMSDPIAFLKDDIEYRREYLTLLKVA